MSALIDAVICVPFGWVLKNIYLLVGSYGLSIILFTILTKIILIPTAINSKRGMAEVQRLQPKIKELEKKYAATNKAKYQEEVSKLYQQEGVSPMGSCLPQLITLPIMIGLYYVINRPLSFIMGLTHDEIVTLATRLAIEIPDNMKQFELMEINIASQAFMHFDELRSISDKLLPIDFNFLGIPLGSIPQWNQINLLLLIPVLSGLTAFLLNRVMTKMQTRMNGGEPMSGQNNMILMTMPIMSLWFGFILPAGVGVYWIVSNLVMAVQEYFISRFLIKENARKQEIAAREKAARDAARKEIEMQRRLENQSDGKPDRNKKEKGGKK